MPEPIYILLYSGGVDSVLCLKKIIERGITPFLFHFRTKKLTDRHERMIKRSARLLSPESPLYVFKTETDDYEATHDWGDLSNYEIYMRKGKKCEYFVPLDYGDFVIIGYMRQVYSIGLGIDSRREFDCVARKFIDFAKKFNTPFIFPLADYHRWEVDEEFKALPLNIRENTVSSTRDYDFGGGVFVKPKR